MKRKTFLFFTGPSIVAMVVLMIIPLLAAVYLGFNFITYRNLNEPQWIGLQNYAEVLSDPEFWDSLGFTLLYIAVTVPTKILLGFVIALMLDQIGGIRGVFIAAALLPFVMTPVVGTLIFRDMFDRGGLYNYLLQMLFDYKLLFNSTTVPLLIMLHGIWVSTPFTMIVLFAGLQTVQKEPMEAAKVDGASWLQRLRYVVVPHLRSLFVFIILISIMDGYRVFDSVFVMTQQNPIYDAESVLFYNFQVALTYGRLGKANAMAVLTVIGIFVALIPWLIMTYREQVEER